MMQNSYQFQQKGKNGCFSVLSRATPSVKEIWYTQTEREGVFYVRYLFFLSFRFHGQFDFC